MIWLLGISFCCLICLNAEYEKADKEKGPYQPILIEE